MNRLATIGWALLLGMATGSPASAAANPSTLSAIADLKAAVQKNDCAALIPPARIIVADSQVPEPMRARLYEGLISCEEQQHQKDAGYRDSLAATALSAATDGDWLLRIGFEIGADDKQAALETLERMAGTHPLALGRLDIEWLAYLHHRFDEAKDEASDMRLLRIIATAYVSPDPFVQTDLFKVAYAHKLVAQGKPDAAHPVLNAVVQVDALMKIALDQTLRDLRDAKIDFASRAAQQVRDDQSDLASHPESLAGVTATSRDLNRLGKYRELLEVLETMHAHIDDPRIVAEQSDEVNWWWNQRAYTYFYLGDYAHMVESFRGAITAGEGGRPNVSQILNLAEVQIRLGRYEEALATLGPAGDDKDRSPYGNMIYRETHGCAAYKTGKKDLAAADVDYVQSHEKDGRGAARSLLLCVGDVEGGAAILIRQLGDPDNRVEALRELSTYQPDPVVRPVWPGDEKLDQIKARPDVRSAIDKAGGTLSFPFLKGEF